MSLPRIVSGATFTATVLLANDGEATWRASGPERLALAYHWFDAQGRPVVWDGRRTELDDDIPPGGTRAIAAAVDAPTSAGPFVLAFDLVREGVGWLGKQTRVATVVEPALVRAAYEVAGPGALLAGSRQRLEVRVRNEGNVAWEASGRRRVALAYHWYDSAGNVVLWDGPRAALGRDVGAGASATIALDVSVPERVGTYVLVPELVREGVGWFSDAGGAAPRLTVQVKTPFHAGYEATTTPSSITPGGRMPVSVTLVNAGLSSWIAGGSDPVRVSYHWYDADGNVVTWDGARAALPRDVPPGGLVSVLVDVVAPSQVGWHTIAWDAVRESTGWFSASQARPKREPVLVEEGVTLYGKGWGHGVGLSQWGAQGWAQGAGGEALSAQQIVAKYYPGAVLTKIDDREHRFRVLLSSPSHGCVQQTIHGVAHARSDGGVRVVVGDETVALAHGVRVAGGWSLQVVDQGSGALLYRGYDDVVLVPANASQPIEIGEKGLAYRGTIQLALGGGGLRVVNWVSSDDYMRGSLPGEMPAHWEMEALKAQAYAGRTYAAWRQSGSRYSFWDVRDDDSDQCYGGASFESPRTNAAVAATASTILTHEGRPIRAYYSSAHGGISSTNGCVWDFPKDGSMICGEGEPYLAALNDPAELLATDRRGANPHRIWSRTFTGWEVREAVLEASGIDIGDYVALDLSNVYGGGHVISVRVQGTWRSVELRADRFLRGYLGLKSTLVKLVPW